MTLELGIAIGAQVSVYPLRQEHLSPAVQAVKAELERVRLGGIHYYRILIYPSTHRLFLPEEIVNPSTAAKCGGRN